MIKILSQLKPFRFVLVKPRTKEAFENGLPGYAWDDPKLLAHLKESGNYGVLAGHEYALIDTDDSELEAEIRAKLPATFEVSSPGHNGTHFYYHCKTPEDSKTIPVLDKARPKEHWNIGHVRLGHGYLVGPGSTHPNGQLYLVKQARPFAEVTEQRIRDVLAPWQAQKAAKTEREYAKSQGFEDLKFPITAILDLSKLKKSGDTYIGPHPVHSSTTGTNFHVDSRKNVWHCKRCVSGGGPLQLLAVLEKIRDCDNVNPLRDGDFRRTREIAIARNLVGKSDKKKKADSRKDTESEEAPPELAFLANLPDWESDGRITVTLKLDKQDEEGERIQAYYRLYVENGVLKNEPYKKPRFLPPTAPSQAVLNMQPLSFKEIHAMARAKNDKHLYFTNDLHYDLLALGSAASYFREVFESFPYFDFLSAENGWGKTTAMKCLIWASFFGILQMNPSNAVLFRMIEDSHGGPGIDQVDDLFKNPKQNRDILTTLDSGYSQGIPCFRVNMDSSPPGDIIPYDAFSLKAFTRTGWIPPDLVSRSITIKMVEAKGFKILPKPPKVEELSEIRDNFYVYRLWKHELVARTYAELSTNPELTGRLRDIYLPLLTMAKLHSEELYEKVLAHAKLEDTRRGGVKRDTRLINVVEYLDENAIIGEVPVANIRDGLDPILHKTKLLKTDDELTSQQVITWLEGLGFERSSKRTGNNVHYNITGEVMDRIRVIYLKPETLASPKPTQTNLTKLTKLTSEHEGKLGSLGKLGSTDGVDERFENPALLHPNIQRTSPIDTTIPGSVAQSNTNPGTLTDSSEAYLVKNPDHEWGQPVTRIIPKQGATCLGCHLEYESQAAKDAAWRAGTDPCQIPDSTFEGPIK